MLNDNAVQMTEWQRRSSSPFIISALWKYLNEILDLNNWEQHMYVRQFYRSGTDATDTLSPDNDGRQTAFYNCQGIKSIVNPISEIYWASAYHDLPRKVALQ